MEEKILVVPRDKLFAGMETPQGFDTEDVQQLLKRIRDSHQFLDRKTVEEDPSFKQIIPYMVLCCGDKLFLMRRFDNQDEKRLRNLYSLGVGGHINLASDAGAEDVLIAGLERELAEEVEIDCPYEVTPVGYINDESNPVGQVHFGLAYRVALQSEAVTVHEKELMSASFVSINEAQSVYPQMETWSQIVLKSIDAFFPKKPGA